jgi:nitrate reductase cytochrome c-type subunit
MPAGTQSGLLAGESASSEDFIGCSSCHYGASAGIPELDGPDANDTAHRVPYGEMANADICGACHSRYSYTADTYTVQPTPDETPPVLLQPQMAIGFPELGMPASPPATGWVAASPLSDYLNVPSPGWTPTPNPSATTASGLMTYWQMDGVDTMWQARGHDGDAAQYPAWASEGHAIALEPLRAIFGDNIPSTCLECHSADYRIAEEAGKTPPTGAQAKYGVTCVGCHTPHDAGTTKGVWDEAFDAQLIGNPKNGSNLCITCHNGELPVGTEATPGTEIHHPMKEMMAGYGAIGVDEIPSVHEGKCIQCHMPPTAAGTSHGANLGANHTFTIIEPEVAATVDDGPMPYSACSTCHGRASDPLATYLQGTIEQRQSWTKAKIAAIWDELDAAAVKLGYADTDAAHTDLTAMPEADWTNSQRLFLSSFTNVEFVDSEGSYGIHNWAYSVRIVNTAMNQAKAVTAPTPRKYFATLTASSKKVRKNQKVRFKGAVQTGWNIAASGKAVKLLRKKKGHSWRTWKKFTVSNNGSFSKAYRMTARGTWYFKIKVPGDGGLNLTNYSRYRKVVVR